MSRYIQVAGTNTIVGFNYEKQLYYITNTYDISGTPTLYTTYRSTIAETQTVLNSLDISTITDMQLQELHDNMETLTNLYYTWDTTGSYINSIQFNDYNSYPLVMDCTKGILHILNSDITYNMEVNESPSVVRIPYLCNYYASKVGLTISQEDMLYFYNLLTSYYAPTVYNQIASQDTPEAPLTYSNIFALSNYNKQSKASYTCTYNPYNANSDTYTEADIYSTSSTSNTITLSKMPSQFSIGSQIQVSGITTTIDTNTYTADGTYTITNIEGTNITVEESMPISYSYPFYKACLVSVSADIESIERNTNSIILEHQVPNTIFVGDTITLTGTTYTTDYETITCDGTYTVQSIDNKTIVVEETIPTNYTGNTGILRKELPLGNVLSISELTLHLQDTLVYNISVGTKITVRTEDNNLVGTYTTVSAEGTTIVTSDAVTYTPVLPKAKKYVPSSNTLINVIESSLGNFPKGEFMVNTFTELIQYIEAHNLPAPTRETEDNILAPVPATYNISTSVGINKMYLLGLYPNVYIQS